MAGKRSTSTAGHITVMLWADTVERLRALSKRIGKPQTELADEAITLLEQQYDAPTLNRGATP